MKRLKIFTFPDRNPEYLQLQIDSYRKYMNNDVTDLIVINASNNNESEINDICKNNQITCFRYDGPRNVDFSRYYVEQLNWFRDNFQKKSSDYFMLIHSDMFFVNRMDYQELMNRKKLYFVPQYRDTPMHVIHNGEFTYYYMWDGFLLFDNQYLNDNDLTGLFDWDYIPGISDVGGRTRDLLKNIEEDVFGNFEMWNYYHQKEGIIDFVLNGNINYSFDTEIKTIREKIQMGSRSFPYENIFEDYSDYLVNRISELKRKFIDPYDFPNPVHIDIIQENGKDIKLSPILHFKSGSGYQNFHNQGYSKSKIEQIRKIIFRDGI